MKTVVGKVMKRLVWVLTLTPFILIMTVIQAQSILLDNMLKQDTQY